MVVDKKYIGSLIHAIHEKYRDGYAQILDVSSVKMDSCYTVKVLEGKYKDQIREWYAPACELKPIGIKLKRKCKW